MEININNIKDFTSAQIYEMFFFMFSNEYNKNIKNLDLSMDDYYNIVIPELDKVKDEYDGKESYDKYLSNLISNITIKINKTLISNENTSLKVINNYINKKYINIKTYDDALKGLNDLNSFLQNNNFVPNPDIIIDLLKNNKLSDMLALILKKHRQEIVSGNLEKITNDKYLILSFYCSLNGIDIYNEEELTLDLIPSINESNNIDEDDYTTDSLQKYLNEISKYSVLTKAEEKKLFKKIRKGDESAKKEIIERNLKLVVFVAKKYLNSGLSLLDLVQEGNIGLIKAVDRFDVDKDFKFATYASWWIKNSITKAIADKSRTIRIPVHMAETINKISRIQRQLTQELNREPTDEELAKYLNISVEQLFNIKNISAVTYSLNAPVINDEDEGDELQSFIKDDRENIEQMFIDNDLSNQLLNAIKIAGLTSREIEVIEYRFGLNNKEAMTLDELGKMFGVTRERIRQIEAKALQKLRKPKAVKILKDYEESDNAFFKNNSNDIDSKKYSYLKDKIFILNLKKIFNGYSDDAINLALLELEINEIEILKAKISNGYNSLNGTQKRKYIAIVQKLKNLLTEYSKEEITSDKKQVKNTKKNSSKKQLTDITKEDYTELLESIKTPEFTQMLNTLTATETTIVFLRFGYINNKYFSVESIADFLELSVDEVNETLNRVIMQYNENIDNFSKTNTDNNLNNSKVLTKEEK